MQKRFLLPLLLLAPTGCAGGQTGGEVNTPTCLEQAEEVSVNSSTALGFSAADAVAVFAQGELVITKPTWLPPSDPMSVAYDTPEPNTTLSFAVTFQANAPRLVHSQVNTSGSGPQSAVGMVDELCRDRLELDVRVTLETSGGELNETFDAVLHVFALQDARLESTFDAKTLNGNLMVTTPSSSVEDVELTFRTELADAATPPHGSLQLGSSAVDGNHASHTTSTVATW